MKNQAELGAAAATVSPAEYPLGSPESRAAARAMVERRTAMSPEDEECLFLYGKGPSIHYRIAGHEAFYASEAYRRGGEVRDRLYGPIIPTHLDPHAKRSTGASLYFELVHGREPVAGDVFRRSGLEARYSPERARAAIEKFGKLWTKWIPGTVFPFKWEDGKPWHLAHEPDRRCDEWVPGSVGGEVDSAWRWVAGCALWPEGEGRPNGRPEITATAVRFLGIVGGKHRCEVCE